MYIATTGPRLNRSIELTLQGDWGQANLHRICGWLSQQLYDRSGAHTRIGIWTGRGGVDAVDAVHRGQVDISLAVPASFVSMAMDGIGPFNGQTFPELRALGTMPQTDRLTLAIKSEFGILSFEDLRARRPPLVIATSYDDGINTIGFAVQNIMQFAGISRGELESWGGAYLEFERPDDCTEAVLNGKAGAIFQEAIMAPYWHRLADNAELRYVPLEEKVLARMEAEYRWPRAKIRRGYLRGLESDLETLDFSDFIVLARSDMADDVAYLMAWCMCETREALERFYRHIPPERSPITYPLVPAKIAKTSIALHPGAERYYREAGLL
jgi:uncharacterized protein